MKRTGGLQSVYSEDAKMRSGASSGDTENHRAGCLVPVSLGRSDSILGQWRTRTYPSMEKWSDQIRFLNDPPGHHIITA